MIGLERGVVRLHTYTPEWARLFEAEAERLRAAIGSHVLDIQHVGSTSIPGMVAKPIIDIGIAVVDFDEAHVCIEPIEQLGYTHRGERGIPRRLYFRKAVGSPPGDPRTHHIHMSEITSETWLNLVGFRDLLIARPDLAAEYAALKLSLARRLPADREAYLDGKAPFIERVLGLVRGTVQAP